MGAFLLQRLGQSLLVMLTVAFVSFMLFRHVGDPIVSMVGQETRIEDQEALRASLGLDDPVPVQFACFVLNAARGEFGLSYRLQQPVMEMIAVRAPATLELAFASVLLALVAGLGLGVYTAIRPRDLLARLLVAVSLVGVSLPTFLIGIGLITLFSVELGWLPSYGRGETVSLGGWQTGLLTASGLRSLVLPAVTLSLYQTTLTLRLVRAEMLEVLRSDYVRFARARGIAPRRIYFRHALRNTLVPIVTITGLHLGSVIAFSVVTETVFQWPGLGLLFVQSVQVVDVPVMAAYLMLIAFVFVAINLAVDLLYRVVDPRLRSPVGAGSRAT